MKRDAMRVDAAVLTFDNDDCSYLPPADPTPSADDALEVALLVALGRLRELSPFAGCAFHTVGYRREYVIGVEGDSQGMPDGVEEGPRLEYWRRRPDGTIDGRWHDRFCGCPACGGVF